MKRTIFTLLLALVAAAMMGATFRTDPGSGPESKPESVGRTSYARFTDADADAAFSAATCTRGVKIRFVSNVANASDHDATLGVYDCPKGIVAYNDATCRVIPYTYGSIAYTTLTGDLGRDVIYGATSGGNIVLRATVPASQTAQAEVTCF
jgi:hypothetical protein